MTATTDLQPLELLKQKQHKIWSSGDYNRIAALTVPVSEALVQAAAPSAGAKVLDVATGTGHVALAAARRFAEVSAIDYVEALVDIARRRASAEDLTIDLRVGDAENLPYADGQFDVVLSAIGVMFTANHARAAEELLRVTRPGGTIGLASWTPTGFVGQMLKTVGAHVPPPPAAQPATRWGSADVIQELLGAGAENLRFETRVVSQSFHSAEHFADFFLEHYGPTYMAAAQLEGDARAVLRDDLVAMAASRNLAQDGGFTVEWEYLIALATKR